MLKHIAVRAAALGIAGLITMSIVAALASTADQHYTQACVAHAQSIGAVQQVVVIGQRQPRS